LFGPSCDPTGPDQERRAAAAGVTHRPLAPDPGQRVGMWESVPMIEIGQHGKQAMKQVDERALARSRKSK
jgi:hypothetical protein